MLSNFRHPYHQPGNLHRHRGAVCRNHIQRTENQPVKGIVSILGQRNAHRLRNLGKRGLSRNAPRFEINLLDALPFFFFALIVAQIAHKLLHQVVDGDNANQSAVFIQDHGKLVSGTLHIAEQHICLHASRHKIGRSYRCAQNRLPALILLAEILLGIENANNTVGGVLTDGIAGIAAVTDRLLPDLHAVLHPEQGEVCAVGGDVSGGQIVKLEHILDELLLLVVDGTLLAADVHHHPDFLLADGIILGIRVNPQQPQYGVGGEGQKPNQGGKELGNPRDEGGHTQSQGLRLSHSNTLGHQLAENQGKVGEDQGDDHHGNRLQGRRGNRNPHTDQPRYQNIRKVFSGKRTAQKSGKRDGHLNRRQKAGGLTGELCQSHGTLVAFGGKLCQLAVVH